MSSQAITENDLREILNGVLPIPQDDFVVEDRTTSNLSSSTYYLNTSINIEKSGYKPIAIVGHTCNQASIWFYAQMIASDTSASIGIAKQSGTLSNVIITLKILYKKIN